MFKRKQNYSSYIDPCFKNFSGYLCKQGCFWWFFLFFHFVFIHNNLYPGFNSFTEALKLATTGRNRVRQVTLLLVDTGYLSTQR